MSWTYSILPYLANANMRQDSPTQIPANYIAAIYPFLPQSRRYLDFLKLLILIINKLFNTLFFPILTYYGEVWGGGESMINVIVTGKKTPLRKHICIEKWRLGRLSLKLQITMNTFKFWIHLDNQPPYSIVKPCLNISDKMAQENESCLIHKINVLRAQ